MCKKKENVSREGKKCFLAMKNKRGRYALEDHGRVDGETHSAMAKTSSATTFVVTKR